jgi:hypothetical protein
MTGLTRNEKREIARKVVRIRNQIKKIDAKLEPYKKGDTPTNNIYRWYGDKGKIGQLLRMKDNLIKRRHELELKLGLWAL